MEIKYYFYIASIFFLHSCSSKPSQDEANSVTIGLGEIEFIVSGNAQALPHFNKGLLLLHSFEYADAWAEFVKAQRVDSTFAMAYWGEAMTYNQSLWQLQHQEKALAALQKLAPDSASRRKKIATVIERDFFTAADILFGEGSKYERDIAYKDYMERLKAKYPNHIEVSVFYALSLMAASHDGRDDELYDKSAKIVQSVLDRNPKHPGALHYLIHSYDDPKHAHLALGAADNYAKVAPEAPHALHMPSHIYVALGRWNDVINSNIASWNASIKKMKAKLHSKGLPSYHALHWLQYGLLQRGEVEKSVELLRVMLDYTRKNTDKEARSYLLAMKGAYMIETRTWEGELADIEVNVEDLNILKKAGNAYLEGMKAFYIKDTNRLATIIEQLNRERYISSFLVKDGGFPMCSSGVISNRPLTQLDIDMVRIMELQLKAAEASLLGKQDQASELFKEATELDDGLNYSFGPPLILKPIHEDYAEWLLEQGDTEKALAMFNRSLERNPRRLLSLVGKLKAAELLNIQQVVDNVKDEINISQLEHKRTQIH